MSKRLFIWIGLIILIGVISAAGWSVYVTVNSPATEAPPPPVRGKVPQIPETTSGTTIQPDSVPPSPSQEQATTAAPKADTPVADAQATPAPQSQPVNPAPADQLAEQTSMTPPEQPTQEPVEQAAVETATGQSETQDSEAPPASEPPAKPVETSVQEETPEAPAAEPEPEKQAAQPAAPDPTPEQQPDPQEQASAPSTTEPEPDAKSSMPLDAKFTIQVGSYRNKTNAEKMMAVLSGKGYDAYIFEDTDAKARPWYVVRFGYFPTRQAAQWALRDYEDKEKKKAMISRSGVR